MSRAPKEKGGRNRTVAHFREESVVCERMRVEKIYINSAPTFLLVLLRKKINKKP